MNSSQHLIPKFKYGLTYFFHWLFKKNNKFFFTDGLNNHCINLIRTEFDFVVGKRVRKIGVKTFAN